ncbi:MAG: hypothetical protein ACYCX4_00610 [Bacillota bacterium]
MHQIRTTQSLRHFLPLRNDDHIYFEMHRLASEEGRLRRTQQALQLQLKDIRLRLDDIEDQMSELEQRRAQHKKALESTQDLETQSVRSQTPASRMNASQGYSSRNIVEVEAGGGSSHGSNRFIQGFRLIIEPDSTKC